MVRPKKKKAPPQKAPIGFNKAILEFLQGRRYKPLTADELAQRLSVMSSQAQEFEQALEDLIHTGQLIVVQGRYELPEEKVAAVRGVLRLHHRGFGFVIPDDPSVGPDIFIPKHLTLNAIDGDQVEVVLGEGPVSEKGPEGRIVAVIARARNHLAGTVWTIDTEITVYAPLMGPTRRVVVKPSEERVLEVGDRLIMRVVEWGDQEKATQCEVMHYLGNIKDPMTDVPAAIEEFELRREFPAQALQEATAYGNEVKPADLRDRVDYTQLETVTIDPDTAKDFDDALSIEQLPDGWRLYVHIADVSHYVREGSELNEEAKRRCNSTYFPGTVVPMLPFPLADNLCSLKPNVVRLTITAVMDFDRTGELKDYSIHRSAIQSDFRFTYGEARRILDGEEHPHAVAIRKLGTLARLLIAQRQQRGSVTLSMAASIIRVDQEGRPTGIDVEEYDMSHQMVEEFMLKANEVVAIHLSKNRDLSYRVHEEPSPEDVKAFAEEARTYGLKLPDKPSPQELQLALTEAAGQPWGRQLTTRFIRSLKLAFYSPQNLGHYGLALQHYTHFTSPIRRYVDLIIHRLLFGEPLALDQLQKLSEAASVQERLSGRAESAVTLLKKLRLLDAAHQQDPVKAYPAMITSIRNSGISFEITDWMLDGSLHISELGNDYYTFDASRRALRGRTGHGFRLGDPIQVVATSIDLITLEVKWEMAGRTGGESRKRDSGRASRSSRGRKRR